jgi:hypothetical protein
MTTRTHTALYPATSVATDGPLGTVCFEVGALGVAVLLWLTAATLCIGVPLRSLKRQYSHRLIMI